MMRPFMVDFFRVLEDGRLLGSSEDRILQNYWAADERDLAEARAWNRFGGLCRKLADAGAFSIVVRFVFGVLQCGQPYDREKLRKVLSGVQLTPSCNAAELCGELFLSCQDSWSEASCSDPYTAGPSERESYANIPRDVYRQLAVRLPEELYGLRLDWDSLSAADVDRLAGAARRRTLEKIEREKQKNAEWDAAMERNMAEYQAAGLPIPPLRRHPERTYSEFELSYMVPGALLELYRACELAQRYDLCRHIMGAYVWPVFALVPWEQRDSEKVRLMGVLLNSYVDFFHSQCTMSSLRLSDQKLEHWISAQIEWPESRSLSAEEYQAQAAALRTRFFDELTGNAESLLDIGRTIWPGGQEMARAMAAVMEYGGAVLGEYLPARTGMGHYDPCSFLMAFTPYLLFCSGCESEAVEFLVRRYEEIGLHDREMLYVQVLLSRCILAADRLGAAQTLYGCYSREMDRQERERAGVCRLSEEVVAYLRRVKEYLRQSRAHTVDTGQSWYELLFSDGRIDGLLDAVQDVLDRGGVPSERDFGELMTLVEAFSHPTGIHLGYLKLPNQDGYNKLENALPREMGCQGRGYLLRRESCNAFFNSVQMLELRRDADLLLRHHIAGLEERTLADSVERLRAVRAKADGREAVLAQLDAVIDDLAFRRLKGSLARREVERRVEQMELAFVRKHCPERRRGLLAVLSKNGGTGSQEVRDYLVTAEIVFEMLAGRRDADNLDFSAALIPLTKAMELILFSVYQKIRKNMDICAVDSPDIKRVYFTGRGTPKGHLEFGPLVNLLKDAPFINLDSRSNRLRWGGQPYTSTHFHGWRVEEAVDITLLRRLKGEQIPVQDTGKTVYLNFGQDDGQNRMLLAAGLDYIRVNYRNVVAHKDAISRTSVEECRKLLLLEKDLLWTLLMLLR